MLNARQARTELIVRFPNRTSLVEVDYWYKRT